jgi:hypothetical protein
VQKWNQIEHPWPLQMQGEDQKLRP